MNKRKIVQINILPESDNLNGSIIALCNDGTLWFRRVVEGYWDKFDDIPQDNIQTIEE